MHRVMMTAAAALVTALAGTAAQAQYAPYPGYPPQPGYPAQSDYPGQSDPYVPYAEVPRDDRVFTGVRAELRLSYDHLNIDYDEFDYRSGSRNGLGYGGEVGFDLPLGGVTLGGYAGIDGSTIRICENPAPNTFGGVTTCFRPGRSITAGGRLGVVVAPSFLLFAKGGYTNAQISAERSQAVLGGFQRVRRNYNGFHVGGGVETAFSRRTYGKLEYIYTKLDARSDDPDDDLVRQQVQAAVGLRF